VNQWLGQRLPGILGAQVAGLVSFVVMIIFALPFVAKQAWEGTAYQHLDDFGTLGALAFTGTGIIFIAGYALTGLLRTRPSEKAIA